MRQMKTTATLPVIVKPAHGAKLPSEARRVFTLEARCTALYDLCRREFGRVPGKMSTRRIPSVYKATAPEPRCCRFFRYFV
ncbi:MAG: hypothetical protein ACLR1T_15990 [Evtepia gabavorous]